MWWLSILGRTAQKLLHFTPALWSECCQPDSESPDCLDMDDWRRMGLAWRHAWVLKIPSCFRLFKMLCYSRSKRLSTSLMDEVWVTWNFFCNLYFVWGVSKKKIKSRFCFFLFFPLSTCSFRSGIHKAIKLILYFFTKAFHTVRFKLPLVGEAAFSYEAADFEFGSHHHKSCRWDLWLFPTTHDINTSWAHWGF